MSFITRCIRKIFCCDEEVILRDDKGSNYEINREECPPLEEENLEHNKNSVSLYKGNDNIVYNLNIDNIQWWPKKLQYPHRLNMKTMNFETDNKLVMSSNMYKKMSF
ncbi:hypothetical protein A0H76_1745 [Hepatospora eriocheir]|uniref:Uncharacterized protein n=1 Tax=Hepatospora eriocheir TaxID=1081669 RepID=A0A1X0Q5L8_9MICR|nr:hypothetical protein A0H76_1745 [Hepatospora eriocheir]